MIHKKQWQLFLLFFLTLTIYLIRSIFFSLHLLLYFSPWLHQTWLLEDLWQCLCNWNCRKREPRTEGEGYGRSQSTLGEQLGDDNDGDVVSPQAPCRDVELFSEQGQISASIAHIHPVPTTHPIPPNAYTHRPYQQTSLSNTICRLNPCFGAQGC